MREHDGAQLMLLLALAMIDALATVGYLVAYDLAPRLTAVTGTAPLMLLWSLWLSSLVGWLRGGSFPAPPAATEPPFLPELPPALRSPSNPPPRLSA